MKRHRRYDCRTSCVHATLYLNIHFPFYIILPRFPVGGFCKVKVPVEFRLGVVPRIGFPNNEPPALKEPAKFVFVALPSNE